MSRCVAACGTGLDILQRIALAYALAGVVLLGTARSGEDTRAFALGRVVAVLIVMIGWTLVLSLTSAPAFPNGSMSEAGTLAAWVDRQLFTTDLPHAAVL